MAVYLDLRFVNKPEVTVNAFAPGVFDQATGDLTGAPQREAVAALVTALVAAARQQKK